MDAERKEMILKIEDISKKFGKTTILSGISMEVEKGEIMGIVGASGCGKSTLLGVIAGMLAPDGGKIMMNGKVISEECNVLEPEKRHMNLVSQNFETCSHKTVYENIISGLKKSWFGKTEDGELVPEVIKLLHLTGLENKYPSELSAGQRQRTVIAAALVTKPEILLLDEPLCSLDIGLRVEMRTQMAMLFRRLGTTVFYVTQDPAEAFFMADRVVILNKGRIEQIDTPQNCFMNPKTETAAALLGIGNRVPGYARVDGGEMIDIGGGVCRTLGRDGIHENDRVTVRFRAENAVWTGAERRENSFPVAVEGSFFEGDHYRVMAKMGMGETVSFLSREYLEKGTEGYISVDGGRVYVYGARTAA